MPASSIKVARNMLKHAMGARLLVLLLSFSLSVWGAKDGDYYRNGFVNPNTDREMYWKDSINVLQDLDQFEALYITYHRCVWTKYGTRYGSGQDYDEQGQDDQDDDVNNGCGGFGGEYFWYLGRTQCFKANVAYSLYGILKGETASDSPCKEGTYINSFFTTFGAESFTGPLGMGVDTANSYCTAEAPDNMYLDDDSVAADDDYLDDGYVFYDYKSFSSYGTGCAADGSFVVDSYKGAFCHGKNYLATLDTLTQYNQKMQSLSCTQIYDANNGYDGGEQQNNDGDGYDFEDMNAIDILSFSKSCSLRQYPRDCPDPFGLKKKYSRAIHSAFYMRGGTAGGGGPLSVMLKLLSSAFLVAGCFLFLSACLMKRARLRRRARRRTRSKKKSRFRRKKSIFRSMSDTGSKRRSENVDIVDGVKKAGVSMTETMSDNLSTMSGNLSDNLSTMSGNLSDNLSTMSGNLSTMSGNFSDNLSTMSGELAASVGKVSEQIVETLTEPPPTRLQALPASLAATVKASGGKSKRRSSRSRRAREKHSRRFLASPNRKGEVVRTNGERPLTVFVSQSTLSDS